MNSIFHKLCKIMYTWGDCAIISWNWLWLLGITFQVCKTPNTYIFIQFTAISSWN